MIALHQPSKSIPSSNQIANRSTDCSNESDLSACGDPYLAMIILSLCDAEEGVVETRICNPVHRDRQGHAGAA